MDYSSVISGHEKFLNSLLDDVGWSRDGLSSALDMVACPIDKHHLVPSSALPKHVEICKLRAMNLSKEEALDILADREKIKCPSDYCLSAKELGEIVGRQVESVPLTIDHWFCTFDTRERSKIYSHLASTLNFPPVPRININLFEYETKESKHDVKDILAATRDQKRRRKSYKLPSKFSAYKQSIRDLIQTQTDLLSRVLNDEKKTFRNRSRNVDERLHHDEINDVRRTVEDNTVPPLNRIHKSGDDSDVSEYRSQRKRSKEKRRSHREKDKTTYYRPSSSRTHWHKNEHDRSEKKRRVYNDVSELVSCSKVSKHKRSVTNVLSLDNE